MAKQFKGMDKVVKARTGLVLDHPFYASIALKLELREITWIETGCTDGTFIGFNPAWIDSCSLDETKTFVAHEAGGHVALLHHLRRGDRDIVRWNVAGDYVINLMLKDAGFVIPKGGLIDEKYRGMSTEQVYELLPPDVGKGKGQDPGKCGCVMDATGKGGKPLSKAERDALVGQTKVMISQAIAQAKACGNMPGNTEKVLRDILDPKKQVAEAIREFVERVVNIDYTWTMPNKRYLPHGLYLPSMTPSEGLGEIAVIHDASGSMSEKEHVEVARQISGIFEEYEVTLCHVLCVDTIVQSHETFTTSDMPIRFRVKGGGGTDFKPGFKYLEQHGIQPKCLIYFTDLECGSFPDKPSYPVLWIDTYKSEYASKVPFGNVIVLEDYVI